MKRCDLDRRAYLVRIARNRYKRRLRRKNPIRKNRAAQRQERAKPLMLSAPVRFCLLTHADRKILLRLLNRIREEVFVQHRSVTINFAGTVRMVADGTILFRSEICRIRANLPQGVRLHCRPAHNVKVSQVLKQVGIYELLGYRGAVKPTFPDVVNWRVAQGSAAEGEKYDEILGRYDGMVSDALRTGLYVGLTEAMTNTRQHAYLRQREDGLTCILASHGWWMFSQEKDRRLEVVFCDLGVGIPGTLPIRQPSLVARLKELFGSPSDGQMIAEAVQYARTRTGKVYRGKGLKQLLSVIEAVPGGRLLIYSNRGCFRIGPEGEQVFDFPDSVLGTIIAWSVPITP